MNLIILGPPGAGKGTQAKIIAEKLDVAHISTGDLLRDELKKDTETSARIKEIMNSGGLVSDEIVVELLEKRVKDEKNGFILDGFPRNLEQAEILDEKGFDIDAAIALDVMDETIVERISGRLFCQSCCAVFHAKYHKPKKENICDVCGAALTQRSDDNAEVVEKRLNVYHELTEPIIVHYAEKGVLTAVDGSGNVEDITNAILSAISKAAE
ncbi:MAG: adenylate kinase [Clostridiales bacterium]|nr:adenylate kinase [Clostridiales bacterium]